MRRALLLPAMLACAGCQAGPIPSAAPRDQHGETHAYLVVEAASVEQGWAAVDAIQAGLTSADKARVRTAAPIGEGPAMFVDFSGTCEGDRGFVEVARRAADKAGAPSVRCSATPPASG